MRSTLGRVVLAATVAAALLVGHGAVTAQTNEQPPYEPPVADVSEYLEAAKLQALASGNVLAGPGQIVAVHEPGKPRSGMLWRFLEDGRRVDDDSETITLTVQNFAPACELVFEVWTVDGFPQLFEVPAGHQSSSITVKRARRINWAQNKFKPDETHACHFLWVIRQAP